MARERLKELATEIAQGTASPADHDEFLRLLAGSDPESLQESGQLFDVAALLSLNNASAAPAELKQKVLDGIQRRLISRDVLIHLDDPKGWRALKTPGASLKLLTLNRESNYAVVMGRLEPGSHYPHHSHSSAENIFIVSGDLAIGDLRLKAGDFHQAAPGSDHEESYSETGCVIIAVLSLQDVKAQLALAAAA